MTEERELEELVREIIDLHACAFITEGEAVERIMNLVQGEVRKERHPIMIDAETRG